MTHLLGILPCDLPRVEMLANNPLLGDAFFISAITPGSDASFFSLSQMKM